MSSLHCYQQGDGESEVIFVHGLFGSGRNWHTYLRYVHQELGMVCSAPDLRGHGNSENFSDVKGIAKLVEDIYQYIQQKTSSQVHLIGHSLGGRVAMILAEKYPNLFKKIMILDTGLSPIGKDIFTFWQWHKDLPIPVSERRDARNYFDTLTDDQRLRNFLLTNLVKKQNGYEWRIDVNGLYSVVSDLAYTDLTQSWKNISVPIWLMRGTSSTHLIAEEAKRMREIQPNTTFIEVENAGHWVHADNPEQFKKSLSSFLKRNN